MTEVPAIVKTDLSDEEAYVYVIETNLLQRSFAELLPSEKAAVLVARYEKISSQGKRNDIRQEIETLEETCGHDVHKSRQRTCGHDVHKSQKSRDGLGEEYGMTGRNIARYMRLDRLIPEFKDAATWRESGINILNREIKKQVYDDGGQYELDPHYHLAAINIFCKALRMADCNGFRNEFPAEYLDTVKKMIEFYTNICFPDYTNPCFSDAKLGDYKSELANYRDWVTLFPDSEWIRYYATEGREGAPLPYLSHGSLASGFFTFRSGWKKDAAVMVVKAGPKGEWHCQPDNGTFEFWFNGKNLFPDSGAYVYAGSDEVMKLRNWFRQTRVHNTLTLDGRNFETTQSVTKLWQPEGREQILVTENPSYQGLKHRRTVFFVEQTYYVIVDEAVGDAKGTVNLNYHFCEGTVNVDVKKNMATTAYAGPSNVKLQCFPEKKASLKKEEGWRSIAYRQRVPRTSLSFDIHKDDAEAVRYITVIYPVKDAASYPVLKAKFLNKDFDEKGVKVEVSVNGVARQLMSQLK